MPVQHILDHGAFMKLLEDAGDKLVVVDFYASWCGPCKQIAGPFKNFADKPDYVDVVFAKVDVDENGETAEACGISCMPTFQFFHKTVKTSEFSGANKVKLQEHLDQELEKIRKK